MLKYLVIFSLLFCTACFAHKKADKSRIMNGMTHEEVLSLIKGRNEILVAEFTFKRGHMMTYQYGLIGKMPSLQDRYYLYFMNDTLIHKGQSEEFETEARDAIRHYYHPKQKSKDDDDLDD